MCVCARERVGERVIVCERGPHIPEDVADFDIQRFRGSALQVMRIEVWGERECVCECVSESERGAHPR